jgi:hypothetical protein
MAASEHIWLFSFNTNLLVTKTRMIFLWRYSPEIRIGKKGAFTDLLIRACASHFRPCFAQGERAN